jgi:predicted naringenin-chalcone synthase
MCPDEGPALPYTLLIYIYLLDCTENMESLLIGTSLCLEHIGTAQAHSGGLELLDEYELSLDSLG